MSLLSLLKTFSWQGGEGTTLWTVHSLEGRRKVSVVISMSSLFSTTTGKQKTLNLLY